MVKIVEIGTGYSPIPAKVGAATELVIEELSKSFVKKGFDVSIVDLEEPQRGLDNIKFYDIKIPRHLKRTTYNLGLLHKVKRVIYSLKIGPLLRKLDLNQRYIFHFHNQYNYYFFDKLAGKRLKANIKTVYTLHSYIWSQNWDEIKKTVFRKYFLEIYSLRRADLLLVLNENAKKNLVQHLKIPEEKIVLMPNGVNTSVYTPLKKAGQLNAMQNKHNLHDEKVLFHVGSVCPRKNQLNIIKGLCRLMKKHNLKFFYAGGIIDPHYFQQINEYIKAQKIERNVVYLGELRPGKELNSYYNIADAFVFNSTSEAFTLVVLEALSAGKPVFLAEAVRNSFLPKTSSNGIIYFNENNFSKTIEKYLFNKKLMSQLSKKARLYIMKSFSWDSIADRHLVLFNKILVSKPSIKEETLKWKH
jgi:glycosyltransferase involved in cell wall biosynthesis